MIDQNIIQQIEKLKKQFEWGTYFLGEYYFTIVTNQKKAEYDLTDENWNLTSEKQIQLQQRNFAALFHEYIHYLHELSTVIGNANIALDLSSKSIFTHNFNPDLKSAESFGVTDKKQRENLVKIIATQGAISGSGADVLNGGKFVEPINIRYDKQEVSFPHGHDFTSIEINVPIIEFKGFNGSVFIGKLSFGKFFIYEGIAYELDREAERNVKGWDKIDDNQKATEYTVLRQLAIFIFPEVEKRTFLSLAVLSLQYIDCGRTFITFLKKVKKEYESGLNQTTSVNLLKEEAGKMLFQKRVDFLDAQEEYKNIFKGRKQLTRAFSFLSEKTKFLYDERIKNPTFEVDLVFENRHRDLLDIIQICDFMYIFSDEDEFMRDFLGTTLDEDTSQALKALLSYDHYHKKHQRFLGTSQVEAKDEHKCPFYHCCNLSLRKSHSEICQKKPWRIFEISANKDNQFCWYGQGVLEFKGLNEMP
ncbi:MAG: hypothetical protein HYZ14_15510 [Bacteroidetes bacterium]|nr:hypothetical protein [Bacteroidota bacterium]